MPYFYPWNYLNETKAYEEVEEGIRMLKGFHQLIKNKQVKHQNITDFDDSDGANDDEEVLKGVENSGYDHVDMITNLGFLFLVIMLAGINLAVLPFLYCL
jgi:hypothetical protein